MDACSGRNRSLNPMDNDLGNVFGPWKQLYLVKYYWVLLFSKILLWKYLEVSWTLAMWVIVHYVFEFLNGVIPPIVKLGKLILLDKGLVIIYILI